MSVDSLDVISIDQFDVDAYSYYNVLVVILFVVLFDLVVDQVVLAVVDVDPDVSVFVDVVFDHVLSTLIDRLLILDVVCILLVDALSVLVNLFDAICIVTLVL